MKKFFIKNLSFLFIILFGLSSCFSFAVDDETRKFLNLYNQIVDGAKVIQLKNEFNDSNNTPKQNLNLIDDTEKIIQTLSSEEFGGRADDTDGNAKTVEYLNNQFRNIGLDYLFKDTYLHKYTYGRQENSFKNPIINPSPEEYNVVGLIKGKNHNERSKAVIVTAHLDYIGYLFSRGDKKELYPGSIDNASGIAMLLKLAYKLKEMSEQELFETDIIIAAVNHEEIGLIGTTALLNDIKDRYKSIYNITFDGIGLKDLSPLIVYSNEKRSPQLSKLIYEYMDSTKEPFMRASDAAENPSDHLVFEKNGIQVIHFRDNYTEEHIHIPTDNVDKIDYLRLNRLADQIVGFFRFNDKNTITKVNPING